MLGKYPGRTIHFIGVVLLGFWATSKIINNLWNDGKVMQDQTRGHIFYKE